MGNNHPAQNYQSLVRQNRLNMIFKGNEAIPIIMTQLKITKAKKEGSNEATILVYLKIEGDFHNMFVNNLLMIGIS